MKYFIIFGPPGAGKGTQASLIVEKFNLMHVSTGDLLRSEIQKGTPLGIKAKALIDDGQLVPDEVVNGMIATRIESNPEVNGFLFDGFPRTVAQAEALDKMLTARKEEVTSVISIMIPDEVVKARIRHRAQVENRADDTSDEVIENRIKAYHSKTEPVAAFYKEAGKYREFDGDRPVEEVFKDICTII